MTTESLSIGILPVTIAPNTAFFIHGTFTGVAPTGLAGRWEPGVEHEPLAPGVPPEATPAASPEPEGRPVPAPGSIAAVRAGILAPRQAPPVQQKPIVKLAPTNDAISAVISEFHTSGSEFTIQTVSPAADGAWHLVLESTDVDQVETVTTRPIIVAIPGPVQSTR